MSVIVFNKHTGKYLRRHSGSFRNAVQTSQYKSKTREMIREKFGTCPSWHTDREKHDEYCNKVYRFSEDLLFDAEPGDARVYATEGSATTSVGVWDKDRNNARTYKLPAYLEIHEIKESFACVMRPDGSSNCDDGDGGS